jgi:hypothetical protein
MSPAYARMPEHYVRKMARAAPNARIIFLLREPVERAWSQFRMAHPTLLASECIAERMRKIHDTNWIYSRYSRTLDLWQRWFPGRLRVFFYDQIAEEPEKLFGDICGFLGISAVTNFDHNKIRQKVFEGPNAAMPNDVRRYFSDLFSDEVEAIHKRYNNSYTKRWLTSLQSR